MAHKLPLLLLLLLAAWLFWRQPLAVPPGLEMDELIEAQIAEQLLAGDWQLFYEAGQGREGLYYYWLAPWLRLVGQHVFSLRLASASLTLLGLSAMTALVGRLFGRSVALLALAYAGTSFWLIFAARSGLRSTSLLLPAALAALFFWRGFPFLSDKTAIENSDSRSEAKGRRLWFLLAGVCLGLTFYAYTAARVLPLVFILLLLYLYLWRREWVQGQVGNLLLMAGATAVVILPLLYTLYSQPQLDQFDFMDFDRPLAALQSGDPLPALQTSWQTLGMFTHKGDPLIFDNIPHRPIFNGANAILFGLGVGLALWRSRRQPAYAFVLLWLVVGLLPGMLSQPAPNFYRTVAAQLVAFVFPALALSALPALLPKRWGWRPLLPYLLALLFVGSQFWGNWQAYFQQWPQVEGVSFFWQTRLGQTADFLSSHATDEAVTLCTSLTYEQDAWWRPAWQSMPYLLSDALPIRYYDCRNGFVWPGERPFLAIYPDDIPQAEWWQPFSLTAKALPEFELAWRVEGAELLLPDEQLGEPLQFGDGLWLLGYGYGAAEDGRFPAIVTVWEVSQPLPPRLALFTHLLDDEQAIIAQQDGLPLSSHTLQPGDRFWVRHNQIWQPAPLPDGDIAVAIGLYSQDTGARLPLQAGGDRLFLQPLGEGLIGR